MQPPVDPIGRPLPPAAIFSARCQQIGCQSPAHGVGNNPYAFADVTKAGIDRSEDSPSRIEPHRGQVPENSVKPPKSEDWRVLHEDEARFHLANDPSHLGPQSGPLSVEAVSRAGHGHVLAREPTTDDVDAASPVAPVEGPHVVPDREPGQEPIPLPLQQHVSAVGLDLDSAHGSMPEKDPAEDASPAASKKV